MDEELIESLTNKYKQYGANAFYKSLLAQAIKHVTHLLEENKPASVDKEFINLSDRFLQIYRSGGEDIHLQISNLFRKAAHKIHRLLLKKHLTNKSDKFLNLV